MGFEADLISFIMASEVAFFRARDWADFWVLKGICGRNGDWFLEGGRESGFETLVIALNPSWIIIVSIRERPAESLRGFLTEGRVETFWERTDFLDRALEPWFCRWLEGGWGLSQESTLMNSRRLLGTHFAPVISSWNSPLGILWGAAKVVAC